jgi:hypothetical protein
MSEKKTREFAKGVYLNEKETKIGQVTNIYITKRFIDEIYPKFKDQKEGIGIVAFKKNEKDEFGTHTLYIDSQD